MKFGDLIQTGVAIAALVGVSLGAMAYFAPAAEVDQRFASMSIRLEQKILSDAAYQLQVRMWAIQDRNPGKAICDWSAEDRDAYRQLELQKKNIDQELQMIREKAAESGQIK